MYEVFEKLMKEKGVTPYRVGKDTGINPSTFTNWKKGAYEPKIDKMQKIADYFGVSLEYLMIGEDILDGVEDTLEYKMGGVSCGEDDKKRDFINVMLDLADLNDYEGMEALKIIAFKIIESNKKG